MKKLFLGVCFIAAALSAVSQTISGQVTDAQTHQPISGATVFLNKSEGLATTESGSFSFGKLKSGAYQVQVTAIGYKKWDSVVAPGARFTVQLQPWKLFMQPVEVKALRAADKAPFTKTNISKATIEAQNLGQDLPFLLNQTPSVVINSDAGNGVGYTGIRIRGSDATRINMTINGIPYNDAESQGLFFVNLPDLASSVSSIQIQRGVGTSSNGAGAFGASMNFSTNEVNTNAYAEFNNSVGSFNTWKHTVKAGTGLIGGHFTVDMRMSKIQSDGYIDRASTNLGSLYFSTAYLTEKSSLRFNIITGKEKTYQAWYGVTDADLATNRRVNYAGTEKPGDPYKNETDNYQQDHYQLFFNHEFNKLWQFNTALFLTKGRGYYEQYKADVRYSRYGLPNFVVGNDTLRRTDLIRQLWLDNNFYGQVFSLQRKGAITATTIGGGWNQYDGHHFGEIIWAKAGIDPNTRWYDHKAKKTDLNIYIKEQIKLNKFWQLVADLQYRNVGYTIDGFRDNPTINIDQRYNFFNPKLGVTYSKGNLQWFSSVAVGQKEPNRDDFEAGATQIPKPEKLIDFETGLEKRSLNYHWSATAFYMDYRDQLVLTGKINDVGAYTRTNIDKSFRAGIELEGAYKIQNWLTAQGNFTWSANKIKNFVEYYDNYDDPNGNQKAIAHGTTDIALSPAIVAGSTITATPFKNANVAFISKYVSRQYLDNTSNKSRSLAGYGAHDLRVQYLITGATVKETRLIFQLNNVFNKMYEPNGYTYSYQESGVVTTANYYFPMAGRNVMVAVNFKL